MSFILNRLINYTWYYSMVMFVGSTLLVCKGVYIHIRGALKQRSESTKTRKFLPKRILVDELPPPKVWASDLRWLFDHTWLLCVTTGCCSGGGKERVRGVHLATTAR